MGKILYAENDAKVGFWLCWLYSKFSVYILTSLFFITFGFTHAENSNTSSAIQLIKSNQKKRRHDPHNPPQTNIPRNGKIRFLTFHYNQPELIFLQNQAFKAFIQDDYEMIVFNDAATDEMAQQIQLACEKAGVHSVRYEQHWHETNLLNARVRSWLSNPAISFRDLPDIPSNMLANGSVRHCHVIQYALDNFGYQYNDIVVILDGDLIPIRPISVRSLLHNAVIAGSFRGNFLYFWVTFIAMDMLNLPDKEELFFSIDVINNVLRDSGAHSYYYLQRHRALPRKIFQAIESHNLSSRDLESLKAKHRFTESEYQLIKTIIESNHQVDFQVENHFLHLRASRSDEVMRTKLPIVKEFVLNRIANFQKTGNIE